VDATITAAWIGGGAVILSGGWTALVAVTTTRNARRTNQATLDAAAKNTALALDAAREDRIWDKRADAYVDALYVIRHRQERRGDRTRTIRFDKATEDRRQEWLASFKLPDEISMEMRLLAYASESVLAATRAAGEANAKAESAYLYWKGLIQESQLSAPDAPIRDQATAARKAMQPAVDEATRADEALLDAVRSDLHSRPSQMKAVPVDGTERGRSPS
jgi:hypothetical protein